MPKRNVKLRGFVAELNNKNLNDFLFKASSEPRVDTLFKKLERLDEVVVVLQNSVCTFYQTRSYLSFVLDVYPTLEARLTETTRIVHSASFESGILKAQVQQRVSLTLSKYEVI